MVANKQTKMRIQKYDVNTKHDLSMKLYNNQRIIQDIMNYLVDNTTTDSSEVSKILRGTISKKSAEQMFFRLITYSLFS